MIKSLIKFLLYFLIILIIFLIYLSYFGIETKRFNQLIKDKITKIDQIKDIELKEVKIIVNLSNFSVGLKTYNPNLIFENKIIKLEKARSNFSISSFIKREFAIKNILISTKKNNLKDILNVAKIYQKTPQLFILDKITENGTIIADINLNFNKNGKVSKNYNIKGFVRDGKLRLLNKQVINNIDFNFEIKDKLYLVNDIKLEFNQLKLLSNSIQIKNKNGYFLIEGDCKNLESLNNTELLAIYFKNLNLSDLNFVSENNFSFKLSNKLKFSDINVKSKINLKKLNYKAKYLKLKKYLPNYNDSFELNDHKVQLVFINEQLSIKGKGKFLIDKSFDEIDYDIKFKNGDYDFKSKILLKNNPINIGFLNYEKENDKNSLLDINGLYKKNGTLLFNNITFQESENKIFIKDLSFNKNFAINYINNLDLDFLNKNKLENKISLKRNKKNYEISGKSFDGTILLDKMIKSDEKNAFSNILNDISADIKFNIDQTYIDNYLYLNGINGNLEFSKNNLVNLNLIAKFKNDKKLSFKIKTNENNEKITTIFSEYAKPLVKKYEFIKGFEEGTLDFYSIKKNNSSTSNLKIHNFKLKEMPALTKILTLASLQGIADLLTGEGIRFNEFEMNFSNKNKNINIEEIYAIGPAISIMMSGYILDDDLVSLRGTLVPATTINKFIGSIPLLGDILVGKKIGEGVFGVSFKIKGAPKDLKTTVNPIKTLTPRFITRTLEKIKKAN